MINQRDVSQTQGILEEDLWILREGPAGGKEKGEDKIVGSQRGGGKRGGAANKLHRR